MISFKNFVKAKKMLESVYTNSSGKKFWGDIGAGILPISSKTSRFLIGLRSQWVNEPRTWGLFGGALDKDDNNDPEKAALRELSEELGYEGNIKIVPSYVFKTSGFSFYNFLGIVEDEFSISLDPQEHWELEDIKWVSLDELLSHKKLHFGIKALLSNNLNQIEDLLKSFSK